jgi:hypothetical protein
MKKLTYGGALFLLLALAWGQEGAPNDALLSGVKELNAGNYAAAVADFRE